MGYFMASLPSVMVSMDLLGHFYLLFSHYDKRAASQNQFKIHI